MQTKLINSERYLESLLFGKKIDLFPKIENRQRWEAIDSQLKSAIIKDASNPKHITTNYSSDIQQLNGYVIAECLGYKGRFLNSIIKQVADLCKKQFWTDDVSEIIDCNTAKTGATLALTYCLMESELNKISPLICKKIEIEITRRIFKLFLDSKFAFTPSVYADCLICFLLISNSEVLINQAIEKVLVLLEDYIEKYNDDGFCEAGVHAWSENIGYIYNCFELLFVASEGRVDLFTLPKFKAMCSYIYKVYIIDTKYINIDGSSPNVIINPYLVYCCGKRTEDDKMVSFAGFIHKKQTKFSILNQITEKSSFSTYLNCIFTDYKLKKVKYSTQFILEDTYFEKSQVMVAREQKNMVNGLFLCAKSSIDANNGHFLIYKNGLPFVISHEKNDCFEQKKHLFYNILSIGQYEQVNCEMNKIKPADYEFTKEFTRFSIDLSKSYPTNAGVLQYRRFFCLNRLENNIEIKDVIKMVHPFEIKICLALSNKPDIKNGIVNIKNDNVEMDIFYETTDYRVGYEKIDSQKDNNDLYKLVFISKSKVKSGVFRIVIQ